METVQKNGSFTLFLVNSTLIYILFSLVLGLGKELYTGTPNSDIRKFCTLLCGRNVNKPSAPTEVEGKGLKPKRIEYILERNLICTLLTPFQAERD